MSQKRGESGEGQRESLRTVVSSGCMCTTQPLASRDVAITYCMQSSFLRDLLGTTNRHTQRNPSGSQRLPGLLDNQRQHISLGTLMRCVTGQASLIELSGVAFALILNLRGRIRRSMRVCVEVSGGNKFCELSRRRLDRDIPVYNGPAMILLCVSARHEGLRRMFRRY